MPPKRVQVVPAKKVAPFTGHMHATAPPPPRRTDFSTSNPTTSSHSTGPTTPQNVTSNADPGNFGSMPDYESESEKDDVEAFIMRMIETNGGDADHVIDPKEGATILLKAIEKSPSQAIKFIIDNGGDLNIGIRYGLTPLHFAAAANDVTLIYSLIQEKADINAKTNDKLLTPLHLAARMDRVDACEVLIGQIEDLEIEDSRGRTPLFVAAQFGCRRTTELLIKRGAKVTSYDKNGESCMTYMIEKMPATAIMALDTLHERDENKGIEKLYLAELDGPVSSEHGDTDAHSIVQPTGGRGKEKSKAKPLLQEIVDYKRLSIIRHPVIRELIEVKWKHYGRLVARLDLAYYVAYTVVWTILGTATPWQARYAYTLSNPDWWRVVLWTLAIIMALYHAFSECMEYRQTEKEFNDWKEFKLETINIDDYSSKEEGEEEKKRAKETMKKMSTPYWRDLWNYYDIVIFVLNATVFILHLIDVLAISPASRPAPCCTPAGCDATVQLIQSGSETETSVCRISGCSVNMQSLSVWVNRFFVINIVVMWLGVLKYLRAFSVMGPLVGVLGQMSSRVLGFLLLFLLFYIPFFFAMWMIFGVDSTIESMKTVDRILFSLYRMTLSGEYEYDEMHIYDFLMTYLIVGIFQLIAAILWINLFIALLSETFHRVYSNAKAISRLQETIVILAAGEHRYLTGWYVNMRINRCEEEITKDCNPKEEKYIAKEHDGQSKSNEQNEANMKILLQRIGAIENFLGSASHSPNENGQNKPVHGDDVIGNGSRISHRRNI